MIGDWWLVVGGWWLVVNIYMCLPEYVYLGRVALSWVVLVCVRVANRIATAVCRSGALGVCVVVVTIVVFIVIARVCASDIVFIVCCCIIIIIIIIIIMITINDIYRIESWR